MTSTPPGEQQQLQPPPQPLNRRWSLTDVHDSQPDSSVPVAKAPQARKSDGAVSHVSHRALAPGKKGHHVRSRSDLVSQVQCKPMVQRDASIRTSASYPAQLVGSSSGRRSLLDEGGSSLVLYILCICKSNLASGVSLCAPARD